MDNKHQNIYSQLILWITYNNKLTFYLINLLNLKCKKLNIKNSFNYNNLNYIKYHY